MLKTFYSRFGNGLKKSCEIFFSPRYLFFTNTAIGLSSGGAGDFLNQNFEIYRGHKQNWLWSRTRNQCIQGLLFGATYHFWYLFLDRRFPGTGSCVIFKKLLTDQMIMAPTSVCLYLGLLNFLEGKDWHEAIDSIYKKGDRLMLAEWTFGPVTQLINFYFLPTRFRVLYDSCVCMSFDAYYTYVKYERNDLEEINPNPVGLQHNKSDND